MMAQPPLSDDNDNDDDAPDVLGAWAPARDAIARLMGTVSLHEGYTTPGEWHAALSATTIDAAVALDALYQATGGDALALALVRADLRMVPDGHARGSVALELGALLCEVYALTTNRELWADVKRWQQTLDGTSERTGP